MIVFLIALRYRTPAVAISTLLITFAGTYQYPELGIIMFFLFFLGCTIISSGVAEKCLFLMALFLYPNSMLQTILLPILGLIYGGASATMIALLFSGLTLSYSFFGGFSSYGLYVSLQNNPAWQMKPSLLTMNFDLIWQDIMNGGLRGFGVLYGNLFQSPIHVFQLLMWMTVAIIPSYPLRKKPLTPKSWIRSIPYIFLTNLLVFTTYLYSMANGDFTLILSPSSYLSSNFIMTLLGSTFAVLLYPAIYFYYHEIERIALHPDEPELPKPSRPIKEEKIGEPPKIPLVKWEDVGGLTTVKKELREAIELPALAPQLFDVYRIKPTRGVLLFGPTGCGKTQLVRIIASQIKARFREVKGSDIMSKYFGDSEQKVSNLFVDLRKNTPAILCIDEAEVIFHVREESSHEAHRDIVSTFLSELDGVTPLEGVFIIAMTNKPEMIDEALLRPGRLDKIIYVPPPDAESREAIFKIYLSGRPLGAGMDFSHLAQMTERWSGADIELVCNEAAATVATEIHRSKEKITRPIEMSDIEKLIQRRSPSLSLASLRKYEEFKIKYERRVESSESTSLIRTKFTWDDIGGYDEVKLLLREAVEYPLTNPEMYEKYKVKPPRGIIFYGPPGTGKTLFVKALSSQCGATFLNVRGPEILNKWVGESESRVRELFDSAKEHAPSIIFFDEIDAIAPRRGMASSTDVTARIVSQLLTEMDGVESASRIIVVATTNRLDMIDEALLRPGRFDKIVHIPLPDAFARRSIFEVHLRGRPLADDVDITKLADSTEGFSGADISATCNEAAMSLLRLEMTEGGNENRMVNMVLLKEAIEKSRSKESSGRSESIHDEPSPLSSEQEKINRKPAEKKRRGTIW